jgi:hypothetical protein
MDLLAIKLKGKKEDPQCVQVLVPLRHLPINPNVCGLCCCLRAGYCNEELPLEERMFPDTWDINSSKD